MAANKPEYSIRVGGIQLSVWGNETDKGVMRSVTINKSYMDKNKQWQTTTSFKPQDLALIEIGMKKVMEYLYIKDSKDRDVAKEQF